MGQWLSKYIDLPIVITIDDDRPVGDVSHVDDDSRKHGESEGDASKLAFTRKSGEIFRKYFNVYMDDCAMRRSGITFGEYDELYYTWGQIVNVELQETWLKATVRQSARLDILDPEWEDEQEKERVIQREVKWPVVTDAEQDKDGLSLSVISLDCKSHYLSVHNERGQYLRLDFGPKKVQVTAYGIRSWRCGCNELKSWEIQVSNDCLKWTTISSREDDYTLKGRRKMRGFQIGPAKGVGGELGEFQIGSSEGVRGGLGGSRIGSVRDVRGKMGEFQIESDEENKGQNGKDKMARYVQLVMTGKNHSGNYHLALSAFELYGNMYNRSKVIEASYPHRGVGIICGANKENKKEA